MKSLLTVCVLSLLMIGQSLAQKDPKALGILEAMSAKYKKIEAFNAQYNFSMENPDEGIDEGFEGTIFVKGDKYKIQMTEAQIYFDGTDRWTYMEEDKEVTVEVPEEEEISISNIFDIYKTGYKYLYLESREKGQVDVVDLVPEDLELEYFKIRMQISAKDRSLISFKVFDKSGSRYVYKIKTFQADSSLMDADFVFDAKKFPGVEVIDFR